jgi:hypothetical protein
MPYASIKDTIFTGPTGRELRRHPPEVRELQFYICAGPGHNPFGVFILEPEIAGAHLGRPAAAIAKGLEVLTELEFCAYDATTQFLWVFEMAYHQFGTPLKESDNRCLQAQRWYAALPRNPFLGPWFDRYAADFHLTTGSYAVDRRTGQRNGGEGGGGGDEGGPLEGRVLSVLSPPVVPEGVIGGSGGKEGEPDRPPVRGRDLDTLFDLVWAAHPNAVEKKTAKAAFWKIRPTPELVDRMLAAIGEQKQSEKWRSGFIPKVANWLEKECWNDRVEQGPVLTARTAQTLGVAERFAQKNRQP